MSMRSMRKPPLPLPIIGMSASSDADSRDLALIAGHTVFINKPFAFADLAAAIDR